MVNALYGNFPDELYLIFRDLGIIIARSGGKCRKYTKRELIWIIRAFKVNKVDREKASRIYYQRE